MADEIGNRFAFLYHSVFMTFAFGQYALQLAYGVGLILLPLIHDRACADSTQPNTPAVQIERESSTPDEQSSSDGNTQRTKTKKPLSLAAMVPDVVVPRWPGHVPLAAERREQPLPVAAWRPSDSPRDDGGADQTARLAYLAFLQLQTLTVPQSIHPFVVDERVPAPSRCAFLNSITITGPPVG